MFAASTVLFVFSLLSLTSVAKPLSYRREQALMLRNAPPVSLQARGNDSVSFNNWNNISQLQGFDDFNGKDNFNGGKNDQTIVIKEVEQKCEVVKVEIVQQKLAILQEIAKRIITEQICDVQVQTIVLEQHNGALQVFRDDIQRKTVTKQVGYDEQIASKLSQIVQTDGTLSVDDNGFSGSDVGKNLVVPSGNNWDDATGPARVQAALDAAESALNSTSTQ
jgi:predicted restriction endonuclease